MESKPYLHWAKRRWKTWRRHVLQTAVLASILACLGFCQCMVCPFSQDRSWFWDESLDGHSVGHGLWGYFRTYSTMHWPWFRLVLFSVHSGSFPELIHSDLTLLTLNTVHVPSLPSKNMACCHFVFPLTIPQLVKSPETVVHQYSLFVNQCFLFSLWKFTGIVSRKRLPCYRSAPVIPDECWSKTH